MKPSTSRLPQRARAAARIAIGACGIGFVLLIALLAGVGSRASRDWLSCRSEPGIEMPRYIVVMGGGGIPSGSGLMRTYFGARLARAFPSATVVVALPGNPDDPESAHARMRAELLLRGVPAERIVGESRGRNTHEQAVGLRAALGETALGEPVTIVSSSLHLRRCLLSFHAAGFERVGTLAAEAGELEAPIGGRLSLRYGIWQDAQTRIECLREWMALAVYRLRGWI